MAHSVAIFGSLLVILPFILLVVSSFTDDTWAVANGFTFFPKKLSLAAYEYILVRGGTIGRAYIMTIVVTVVGTAMSVVITTMFAYGIAHPEIPGMKVVSFLLIFSMLFHGGLVASYYTYAALLKIKNTLWALLLPNLMMNAFNVILVRNYFRNNIPPSLSEAARIDGASEIRIFLQVNMPLSKPIVATVALLTALAYWNDWQNGLYFLTERGGATLYTIQVILNNINENLQVLMRNMSEMADMGVSMADFPSETVRMAISVVGILPILLIYPFFQQYFVKGITLGGVKE